MLTLKRRDQSTPKLHNTSFNKKPKVTAERNANQIILPPLKPSSSLSQQAGHYAVTVTNSQGLAHLQVFKGTDSEPTWDLYLGYNAVALAASPAVIALGLEDGSLHTFYPAKGCRPAPPLAPPSPLAKVHAVGNAVLILSIDSHFLNEQTKMVIQSLMFLGNGYLKLRSCTRLGNRIFL